MIYLLVDANNVVRSRYEGNQSSAVVNSMSMIHQACLAVKANNVIACFDGRGAAEERRKYYPGYKAKRPPTPAEFKDVLANAYRSIASRYSVLVCDNYEADDLIAAMVRKLRSPLNKIFILSNDSDLTQLISDDVLILKERDSNFEVFGSVAFKNRYHFHQGYMLTYKILKGDSGDGVAGVPLIGEKTATELIQRYGDIDSIMSHVQELKPGKATSNLIEAGKSGLIDSIRKVVSLWSDCPLELAKTDIQAILQDLEDAKLVDDLINKPVLLTGEAISLDDF